MIAPEANGSRQAANPAIIAAAQPTSHSVSQTCIVRRGHLRAALLAAGRCRTHRLQEWPRALRLTRGNKKSRHPGKGAGFSFLPTKSYAFA